MRCLELNHSTRKRQEGSSSPAFLRPCPSLPVPPYPCRCAHLMKHGVVAAVDLVAAIHISRAQEGALALPQKLHLVRRCVRAHQLGGGSQTVRQADRQGNGSDIESAYGITGEWLQGGRNTDIIYSRQWSMFGQYADKRVSGKWKPTNITETYTYINS